MKSFLWPLPFVICLRFFSRQLGIVCRHLGIFCSHLGIINRKCWRNNRGRRWCHSWRRRRNNRRRRRRKRGWSRQHNWRRRRSSYDWGRRRHKPLPLLIVLCSVCRISQRFNDTNLRMVVEELAGCDLDLTSNKLMESVYGVVSLRGDSLPRSNIITCLSGQTKVPRTGGPSHDVQRSSLSSPMRESSLDPPPSSPDGEREHIAGNCTRPGLAEVRVMRGDTRCCCREVVALCVFTRGCVALSSSEPATSNCSSFFEGRKSSTTTRASRQAELWSFSSHQMGFQG